MAAPVAGNILSEVLPYLEIKKKEEQVSEKISVPNITGMTVKDAKKLLKENGLELKINGGDTSQNTNQTSNNDKIITEQIPKEGIKLDKGGYVICNIT